MGVACASTFHMTSEPIRVLIVDDEALARRGLRLHLDSAGGFDVTGEAATAADAIEQIGRLTPDAVFLDVQMPGGDGFSVVEAVGADNMPVTVFVTAYDEHALRAFDANAVDYVLKPIDPARFTRTAERVRTLVRGGAASRRLLVRDGAASLLIDHDDVDWIAADGDYVRIYVRGRGHLVRHTIAGMERRLDANHFARIHRSAIVNVTKVRMIRPDGDRTWRVILADGTSLRLSRGFRDRLVTLLSTAQNDERPGTR